MTRFELFRLKCRRDHLIKQAHELEIIKEVNDLKRDEVANNIEWINKQIFEAEIKDSILPVMPLQMEITN